MKILNFTFCRGCEHNTETFFAFSWTSIQSFRIQVQKKIANIWRIERNGISAIKVWSSATSLFKWRFRSRRRRCCLSSLISNDLLLQNCRCFRPARILMRFVIIYRWFSAQKLPIKSYLGYTYKQQMWATEKLCIGQEFTIKYVTSYEKTYTDGFPFSNGFPFTSSLSAVRTAWLPVS